MKAISLSLLIVHRSPAIRAGERKRTQRGPYVAKVVWLQWQRDTRRDMEHVRAEWRRRYDERGHLQVLREHPHLNDLIRRSRDTSEGSAVQRRSRRVQSTRSRPQYRWHECVWIHRGEGG